MQPPAHATLRAMDLDDPFGWFHAALAEELVWSAEALRMRYLNVLTALASWPYTYTPERMAQLEGEAICFGLPSPYKGAPAALYALDEILALSRYKGARSRA